MRIKDRQAVPRAVPGSGFQPGYVYFQPETRAFLHSHAFLSLLAKVKAHRIANQIPIGLEFEKQVELGVCEQVPHACEKETITDLWDRFINFKDAMSDWIGSGLKIVSEETYNTRLSLCSKCPFWRGMHSFKVSCGKCGCSGLKLNLGTSVCPIGKW